MTSDPGSLREDDLKAENTGLRKLLTQAGIVATEHAVAERLQQLLLEELHHRVKNTLASVMVITSQTLRTADSLEHGRQAIESRLMALGRAHDLLLQVNWASAKLQDVVRFAIEPYDTQGAGRFVIQGPDIQVGSGAVLPLAMVLNELCTNAVKHGALSAAGGLVEITSAVDDAAQRFKMSWIEKGGPDVHKPARRSFGTRLIDSIAGQLQGTAPLRFERTGVVCDLEIPLASLRTLHAI
jgi:two-component sensor histidine kinase